MLIGRVVLSLRSAISSAPVKRGIASLAGILRLFRKRTTKSILAVFLLLLIIWVAGLEDVFARLVAFPLGSLFAILMLLGANLWLVGFRFWRVLMQFSYRVPLAVATRAALAGHVAGLLVFSLFGQVAGRQAVLREVGISPLVNSSLAAYERALLVVISGLLAIFSAGYLFGQHLVAAFFRGIPLIEIAGLIAVSLLLSLMIGRSRFESRILRRVLTGRNLGQVLQIAALTLCSQCLVLSSFVVAILTLQPDAQPLSVFAAAALISFAASLPITVNGWGVREVAAVFVLQQLGIAAADAITVSILIGASATLVILLAAPLAFRKKIKRTAIMRSDDANRSTDAFTASAVPDLEKAAAWLLGMAVALTVFFQLHVELTSGPLNINLADPFAILSLAAVALHCVIQRQLPHWRIRGFNAILMALSLMLLFGFAIGALKIGITQWALAGRLLGWLVVLGYLSAGYLLVAFVGNIALRRLMQTLVLVACCVVLWHALSRLAYHFGFGLNVPPPLNFEAYSGNRNAFVFQLLSVMALLLAYARVFGENALKLQRLPWFHPVQWGRFETICLGVLMVGMVWTGSRAGMVAAGIVLLVGMAARMVGWQKVLRGAVVAASIWGLFWLVQKIDFGTGDAFRGLAVQSLLSWDESNVERWATWFHAIKLWLESPIWGAGLGVFLVRSEEWLGRQQVVHSTPLWILAEFGLIGFGIILWISAKLYLHAMQRPIRLAAPHRAGLIFLFLAFAVFSQFHEIFYQRILWLILGAVMALPASSWAKPAQSHGGGTPV